MMKLKTLKDMKLGIGEHEEIRAEAVKWVKYYKYEINRMNKFRQSKIVDCRENQIMWIMEFFNITSEDLSK